MLLERFLAATGVWAGINAFDAQQSLIKHACNTRVDGRGETLSLSRRVVSSEHNRDLGAREIVTLAHDPEAHGVREAERDILV